MKQNAPEDYKCPICIAVSGIENNNTLLKQDDLVYWDKLVSVWINSFWTGKNTGHVIIVPNLHFENIYDLPSLYGHRIFDISKKCAIALKQTYQCDGITIRQNNEPAGDQKAFHFHLHVIPRYKNDDFNQNKAKKSYLSKPEERIPYANKLRKYFDNLK